MFDAEDSDVSWHWDKDYGMEDFDVNVSSVVVVVVVVVGGGGGGGGTVYRV
jgi:hypothetical protein